MLTAPHAIIVTKLICNRKNCPTGQDLYYLDGSSRRYNHVMHIQLVVIPPGRHDAPGERN